jgi:predicted SAM-dependent methyltransferase
MMGKAKGIAKNSILGGSIVAIIGDLRSLFFNFRSSVYHLKNYYYLSRKVPAEKQLHFGCGSDYKNGFINLDMNKSADYYFDARNKLPFGDETIEYIYSSHFVEHLSNDELMRHFKESFRVLQIGGRYRICIPDFESSIKAYTRRDYERLEMSKTDWPLNYCFVPEHLLSYADYLDRSLHEYGTHKIFLDFEKTKNMLIHSGFQGVNINLVTYDPSIDRKERRNYSIYVEALK